MKPITRRVLGSALAVSVAATTTACGPVREPPSAYEPPTCSDLLDAAVRYERVGTGDVDAILQTLSDRCSNEYEVAIDYLMNTSSAAPSSSCDELLAHGFRRESVALLEQDGRCGYGLTAAPSADQWPDGGIGWDQVRQFVGTVQRVCGPLMSVRETEHGTFVNVGRDYPSVDRFTFIFWDLYLQPIPAEATICGAGEIYLYEGVAQTEMWDPAALEIWR